MRAFLGQFDRVSLGVFLVGAAIGAVWLVALDLGIVLAAIFLLVGSVALIIHHRWIEIALLMVGIGLVVQVGYWIFGAPPEPPIVIDPDGLDWYGAPIVAEVFAPGMSGLILAGGVILGIVVGGWDLSDGRRRERLEKRRRQRRADQMAGSGEG
jgi:hypothetical protein